MKKILLILCLMFVTCLSHSEVFYTLTEKEYFELTSKLAELGIQEPKTYDTHARIIGMKSVIDKLKRYSTDSPSSFGKDFENMNKYLSSLEDKIFVLGGKVTLLEMEILKLKNNK